MNYTTTKTSFKKIPTNIFGSFQSTYIYAKIAMLENVWYSETALGTNPINKKVEIDRVSVTKYVNELDRLGFITIEKQPVIDKNYYRNIYHINLCDEYWIPVANDFINLTNLSAKEKGFAIRSACLQTSPKTLKELCKLMGCKFETCKKYIARLEEEGILSGQQLNEEYFPNLRKEAYKQLYLNKLSELRELTGNPRIQKKLDWLQSKLEKQLPYKYLYEQLIKIETGSWQRMDCKKEVTHMYNIILS